MVQSFFETLKYPQLCFLHLVVEDSQNFYLFSYGIKKLHGLVFQVSINSHYLLQIDENFLI